MYGVHPMYLNLEEDGKANVVLLLNQHAMGILLYHLYFILKQQMSVCHDDKICTCTVYDSKVFILHYNLYNDV